jgi:hypothetical protein
MAESVEGSSELYISFVADKTSDTAHRVEDELMLEVLAVGEGGIVRGSRSIMGCQKEISRHTHSFVYAR